MWVIRLQDHMHPIDIAAFFDYDALSVKIGEVCLSTELNEEKPCDVRSADESSGPIVSGRGSAISNASRPGTDFSIGKLRLWLPRVMATLPPMMRTEPSGQRYEPNGPRRIDSGRGSCGGSNG
jgi:hypothetical protein